VDPDGEGKFHAEVLGWKVVPVDMGPMGTYRLFKRDDDKDAGGMLQKPAESGGPSAWLPYVAVENTDDRASGSPSWAARSGCSPRTSPTFGRFAVIADPTGAMLGILGPST